MRDSLTISKTTAPTAYIVMAFAALYVIWGSTYLGMAIAIDTMPPFLMASTRFFVAGVILYFLRRWLGDPTPNARQWGSAAIIGTLLFLGGNGVVAWAQHWVPSGVAALLITATPFWMTILPWLAGHAPRPTMLGLIGIAVGLIGVGLLVSFPVGNAPNASLIIGSLAIVGASLSWTLGSLSNKRLPLPKSAWMSSATQMLCGAVGLGVAGVLGGEVQRVELAAISLRSWMALIYLIFVGAILGFSAYTYLLQHVSMARISTYAFVNPVVAVFLGWLINNEPIGPRTLLAGALIIAAVIIILRSTAKAAAAPSLSESQPSSRQ
jgi:drug/metabolite transporter (DMT)-like permease